MSCHKLDDMFLRSGLINFFPVDLALKHLRGASHTLKGRVQYRLGFFDMVVSDRMHVIRKLLGELVDGYTVLKRRCEELGSTITP